MRREQLVALRTSRLAVLPEPSLSIAPSPSLRLCERLCDLCLLGAHTPVSDQEEYVRGPGIPDRVRTAADALRRFLARTRPLWLLYLAFVAYGSLSVLSDRYPRIKAIVARVNEWISSS